LFVSAAGCCQDCGGDLASGFEAHHIIPHAIGGATVLDNGEALCPDCHKRRHRFMNIENEFSRFGMFRKDYSWQEEAVQKFAANIQTFYSSERGKFERVYVVEVSPSGGKTIFSMKYARYLIENDLVDKIIWCVPRDSIKIGFNDDARKIEMAEPYRLIGNSHFLIDTDLDSNYKGGLSNFHGAVITYQSLALPDRLDYFEWLVMRHNRRLAFVFDEAHHGSENDEAMNIWGKATSDCRLLAHTALAMTGTAFRSDPNKIAGFVYEQVTDKNGRVGYRAKSDFSFPYGKAVVAGIARKLVIRSLDPTVTYSVTDPEDGEIKEYTRQLSSIPSHHLPRAKHVVFDFERGAGDKFLQYAFEECQRVRATGDADAAILVIGPRDFREDEPVSLMKIKDRIYRLSGEVAVTVESADGEKAANAIRAFKNNDTRWIVAKEMISEGTNLPRIRIVVLLRDILSRVQYEQIVHRATRNDSDEQLQDAVVIQAKLPHLYEWGTDLENEARVAWERKSVSERANVGSGGSSNRPIIEGICAEPECETVNQGDKDVTDIDPMGRAIHADIGLRVKIERHQINEVLISLKSRGVKVTISDSDGQEQEPFSVEEKIRRLIEMGNDAIKAAGKKLEAMGHANQYAAIYGECKRFAGIKGRLEDLIRDHQNPLEAAKKFSDAARRAKQRVEQRQRAPVATQDSWEEQRS
jgi:superfamily II DNA or RNA helicase